MSELYTQKDLRELDVAPVFDDMTNRDISTFISGSVTELVSSGIEIISTGIVAKSSAVQKTSKVITSPNLMKMDFQDLYVENLSEIKASDTLVKQKSAVLKTLQSVDYKTEHPGVILDELKIALEATNSKEFTSRVNTLMANIQTQHTDYLIKNATAHIKEATINVGFAEDITISTVGAKTIIVGNKDGKALLTEINLDEKTKGISTATETIGFVGDGCRTVMAKFDNELKQRGFKYSGSSIKKTGGTSWLPSSKTIERRLKNKKSARNNEQARKLNLKRNGQIKSKLKN